MGWRRLQLHPDLQDLCPGGAGILKMLQRGVEGGVGSGGPAQSLHDVAFQCWVALLAASYQPFLCWQGRQHLHTQWQTGHTNISQTCVQVRTHTHWKPTNALTQKPTQAPPLLPDTHTQVINVHTHTHTHTHMCKQVHIHTKTPQMYAYTNLHKHTHNPPDMHIHTKTHKWMHTQT